LPIFGEKIAFFSKNNVTIIFFQKLAVVSAKNANILDKFFLRKYLKNHNIGPWVICRFEMRILGGKNGWND
jgi:hypothetical protein